MPPGLCAHTLGLTAGSHTLAAATAKRIAPHALHHCTYAPNSSVEPVEAAEGAAQPTGSACRGRCTQETHAPRTHGQHGQADSLAL